jgi:hypothetical protein
MSAIPAVAIERLRRLEHRVEVMRTEYGYLQSEFQHARAEAGRLEGELQNPAHANGRRHRVDEQGRVYVDDPLGTRDNPRTVARYVDDEPAIASTGREVARWRREAADLARRRDELAEKIAPLAQLAAARRPR